LKRLHIITCIFSLLVTISYANIVTETSMTLEALEKMLPENKDIQLAEFQYQLQRYEKQKADGLSFGTLDISLQGIRTNSPYVIFGTKMIERTIKSTDLSPEALNNPDTRNIYDSKLIYSFPIYSGGKITAYQKIATILEHISSLDKQHKIVEKKALLRQTFYKIILIEKLIEHINTIKENTIFFRNSVVALKNEGYMTKTDILQLEARVEEINNLLYELDTNRELAFHLLRYLTASQVTRIQIPQKEIVFKDVSNQDLLNNNTIIQQAKQAIEIQENQIIIAKADLLPQAGFSVEYGTSDRKLLNNASEHDSYIAGIGFKWNLFNGGITKNAIESAQMAFLQKKVTLSKAQEEIVLNVNDMRTKIKNLTSRIDALNKEKDYKKQVYDNYKESYKEQHSSMLDILTYQSKYIEALVAIEKAENEKYEEIFKFEILMDGEER